MQSAKDKVYTEVRNKHAKECEYAEFMKISGLAEPPRPIVCFVEVSAKPLASSEYMIRPVEASTNLMLTPASTV